MDEHYWTAVRDMRLCVADLLDSLDAEEWDAPSLCEGWRVRDVAGHLALVPTVTTWQLVAAMPRGRFDLNRVNTNLARRHGSRPSQEIAERLRRHAGDRRTARVLDTRDSLFDVIVHSQDIAIPLGRELAVPPELSSQGLDRVWGMGWPFQARRRLGRWSLRATDTSWRVGSGPEVAGPALALLLLLTGRTTVAMRSLEGAGVEQLAGQGSAG